MIDLDSRPPISQELGDPTPDFELLGLDEAKVRLSSLVSGRKGAVVVFWGAACAHCRRYDDYLNEFQDLHPELALVAVAPRQGETLTQLRRAAKERSLLFAILHDKDRHVARRWLVAQTPRVFFLDTDRRLLYRGAIDNFRFPEDPRSQAFLEDAIEDFGSGGPLRRAETPSLGSPLEGFY